jgi:hypothetical protein
VASFCATPPARASKTFPTKIETFAKMPCTPTCLLCHTDPNGEIITLRKGPNGEPWALLAFDFLKNSDGTDADRQALGTDLDMDGTSSWEELQKGQSPFLPGDAPICNEIKYGCGASHIARTAPLDRGSAAWLAAAAVGCVLAARRRFPFRSR